MVATLGCLSERLLLDLPHLSDTVFRMRKLAPVLVLFMGLCFATPAAAAPTDSPAPSRVERVLLVIDFFDSPDAAAAARQAAGLDLRPLVPSGLRSPWASDGSIDAASPLFDVEYDFFDPDTPGSLPSGLVSDPTSRSLVEELIVAGLLTCPSPGARFSDTWGAPRPNNRLHVGTDMVAPYGSPVLAIADSMVLRVDRVNSYVPATDSDPGGLSVTLVSSWGDVFYYGHFAEINPEIIPGVRVPGGASLGLLGDSGNAVSSIPHVHIQWHPMAGSPQNPFWVLRSIC